ncbi:6-phospho-beta-glucosidase [Kitasatospora aureofaciens]|uniref:6-phospho-beta-glucosidase n=1 Tax=Kitasatospora aureofaciens TaxID=1894 RepID=A0A1E7MWL7_KITAU|nr:6-phospho-beta-glucosidase [Kitasatospora aureofaciens]QEU99542.1 6-phospho-beta-glucosidase [Streptomyces viridifaciens]ARF78326.1 6-phospho-beta-glucosidase [Kitasatospora aureofaciens]OEV32633.1 6-phospho-beta-glucosidase [Kitasatospora aureofaciens]UKZ05639.1 6-phospho-beta-glucosidase [Streptomyces viridifaciens]GGU79950.1 6-phospho-beta-glucosidase [Kitasatospora aureofaciens]
MAATLKSGSSALKLAVVGGGSTYTPELIDGFARLRDTLPIGELVLIDPAAERLELIGGLARRIFAKQGHPAAVSVTTDLTAGVADADAVLLQLRVGGQAARNQDETWPLECGCVGQETTGAGGLAKALRTVPVVLGIAEQVRRTNPDAWIVDFTNPVGIVTRALQSAGHKAVGLCNVAIGFQRKFAAHLGVDPELVRLDHVGLNHLTWERGVTLLDAPGATSGREVLPTLLADFGKEIADDLHLPQAFVQRLGVVPSYYLRYFYQHDAVVEELLAQGSRAAQVAEIERQLLELYADPALDTKPELLGKRGGAFYSEAAVQLISALLGTAGGASVQVVNTRNDGVLPFLPDDAVIEVPAEVDADGVRPLPQRPVEPLFAGLISAVTSYEHLALDAALHGGRDRVFDALLAHPLVGRIELADQLTDRLLAHNREHLAWA